MSAISYPMGAPGDQKRWINRGAIAQAAVLLLGIALSIPALAAKPVLLSPTPMPTATVRNVEVADVQDTLIAMMMQTGKARPVRQERNVLVFETQLSQWQEFWTQFLLGNSRWKDPYGRMTFTTARLSRDVMVTAQFEVVTTNPFNVEEPTRIESPVMQNELYLFLQMAAAIAEGRMTVGAHNALGITNYKKPKQRKMRQFGYEIEGVVPGGPADKAGLKKGDIVSQIGPWPTAHQSMDALGFMGFLQPKEAVLQIHGKGPVTVVKSMDEAAPPPPAMRHENVLETRREAAGDAAEEIGQEISDAELWELEPERR